MGKKKIATTEPIETPHVQALEVATQQYEAKVAEGKKDKGGACVVFGFIGLIIVGAVQENWDEILAFLYIIWSGVSWFFEKTWWVFAAIFAIYTIEQTVYRATIRALHDFENRSRY